MSKMEQIHDTTSDRAIDLPKGVHVVAQPTMLAGLDGPGRSRRGRAVLKTRYRWQSWLRPGS